MATRHWFPRAESGHQVAGYCCVFLAAGYVIAIALLVGYLIASLVLY
jgi:hypothetical protein